MLPIRRPPRPDARQHLRQAEATRLPDALVEQLRRRGIPEPEREVRFHETRRFRFDLAWPAIRVAVEVQGGTFSRGAHSRGMGQRRDYEKHNLALMRGWKIIYCDTSMIADETAADVIADMLTRLGVTDTGGTDGNG